MLKGALEAHRFSSEDWVDVACRERLRSVVPIVLESLIEFGPRLAFLAGSACFGEAVGTVLPDGRRGVLSDLDLGLVTDRLVPPDRARVVQQLLGNDATSVEVGAGLYTVADLPEQAPTLGLIDWRAHGVVLWGERDLLRTFPDVTPRQAPMVEGVRLLGNRSRELLEAQSRSLSAVHRFAKLAGSLYVAKSVFQRRYKPSWSARVKELSATQTRGAVEELARVWVPFLLDPNPERTPAFDLAMLRSGFREAFAARETSQDAVQGHLSSHVDRGRLTAAASFEVELPEAFLEIPASWRERFREWKAEASERGVGWALDSRFGSTPQYRRLGLAAAYWAYGPERPEPVWGGEDAPGSRAEIEAWSRAASALSGTEFGVGAGVRDRVRQFVFSS